MWGRVGESGCVIDLDAVLDHLRPGGCFITQQVGEQNMRCVRKAIGEQPLLPPISRADVEAVEGLVVE